MTLSPNIEQATAFANWLTEHQTEIIAQGLEGWLLTSQTLNPTQTETRFQTLLTRLSQALYGEVVWSNVAAGQAEADLLNGLSPDDLILWPGQLHHSVQQILSVHQPPQAITWEAILATYMLQASQTLALTLSEAITSATLERQRFINQLRTAADIAQHVNSIFNLESLLSEIVSLLKDNFKLYHAHIYTLDETGHTLVMQTGSGEAGRRMKEAHHSIPLDREQSLVARAARQQDVVLVNDVQAEADFLPNELLPHTRAEVAVPITFMGHLLGVFDVQADTPDYFTASDCHVFEVLAGQIATAINNARTFEERKQTDIERQALQQALIDSQQAVIQELLTPIIPIFEGVIIMPLVGSIDTMRARNIMHSVLDGITEYRADILILDLTGVAVVDSGVAGHLHKTVQAARLKGTRTIITGITEAIAETIVDLGIDWSHITTLAKLQTALVVALENQGLKLERLK